MSGSVLERLAVAIEDRLEAASPGPWEMDECESGGVLTWQVEAPSLPGNISEMDCIYKADAELILFLRDLAPALPGIIRGVDQQHFALDPDEPYSGSDCYCGHIFPCADRRLWLDEAKRQGISE